MAISQLLQKASRAYFSIRQDFNFHNNTSPKVMLKLFETMIQPILLYGCELWGIYGWKKNTLYHIHKYLLSEKLKFETLHTKMCRNILGVHRKATGVLAKAELGRYPLMTNIIKNTYTYWQHILNSKQTSLLHSVFKTLIDNNRNGKMNFYSRIKGLLVALQSKNMIHKETKQTDIKRKGNSVKANYQELYEKHFFTILKTKAERPESGGRFEIYSTVKKQYRFEQYLFLTKNSLRRNITNIRISTHNLPIESLRKANIKRQDRLCPLCSSNVIGSEFHAIMVCPNPKLKQLRHTLDVTISALHNQWDFLTKSQKFVYLILAVDKQCMFYFAIFLDKLYKEYKHK